MSLIWIDVTKNSHMRKTTLSKVWSFILETMQHLCHFLFAGNNFYIHVIFSQVLTSDFRSSLLVYGRCFSVQNIANLNENQFIKLNLNMNFTFKIFIHDPDFFFLTQNPQGTTEAGLQVNMQDLRKADNITRHIST